MADGASQHGFGFHPPGVSRLRPGEIVVDLFAGGGGASEALRQALGRDPDICINHDEWAIGMHAANHPLARHLCEDVWHADPRRECASRLVGWMHASPDCTHFSQAKGGQPRSRATRSLSWVVIKWAGTVLPRIISLENVEQILKWGPLIAKRDKSTGRIVTLDTVENPDTGKPSNRVAGPGEQVPIDNQFLIPDKRHQGRTWRAFVAALRALGYTVEWRKLRACDYGAGTSRTRLFMIARRDGEAIQWPDPTHGPNHEEPFVVAADCIDWSIHCPSIFTRKKPLADATMRRIARGIKKYVIDAAEPFIVPATHQGSDRVHASSEPLPTITAAHRGELMAIQPTLAPVLTEFANASRGATWSADEPLRTQCAQVKGGHFAMAAATLVRQFGNSDAAKADEPVGTITANGGGKTSLAAAHLVKFRGNSAGTAATDPVPTITSGAGAKRPAGAAHALGVMTAFIEQANGGPNNQGASGHDARSPVSTITGAGSQQRLCAASIVTMRGDNTGAAADDPLRTISAGGEHHGVLEYTLSPEHEAGALRVAAFLVNYYGNGTALDCREPLDTVTTRDRLALVTVTVQGTPYVIVDIGLRMLRPVELYRAQGFPTDYIIDRTADGRPISGTRAVRMVGNSVSPPPLRAIAGANLDRVETMRQAA